MSEFGHNHEVTAPLLKYHRYRGHHRLLHLLRWFCCSSSLPPGELLLQFVLCTPPQSRLLQNLHFPRQHSSANQWTVSLWRGSSHWYPWKRISWIPRFKINKNIKIMFRAFLIHKIQFETWGVEKTGIPLKINLVHSYCRELTWIYRPTRIKFGSHVSFFQKLQIKPMKNSGILTNSATRLVVLSQAHITTLYNNFPNENKHINSSRVYRTTLVR